MFVNIVVYSFDSYKKRLRFHHKLNAFGVSQPRN